MEAGFRLCFGLSSEGGGSGRVGHVPSLGLAGSKQATEKALARGGLGAHPENAAE